MKKVEATIKFFKLDGVDEALSKVRLGLDTNDCP